MAFVKEIAHAQSAAAGVATIDLTVPITGVAQDNVVVLYISCGSSSVTISSCTDSRGNTYAELIRHTGNNPNTFIWKATAATALQSGDTITVNLSAQKSVDVLAVEFDTATVTADGTNSATGTSTTPSAAITQTQAADILLAAVSVYTTSGTFTEDADNTGGDTWHGLTAYTYPHTGGGVTNAAYRAYKITTSAVAQTYDPTLSDSLLWVEVIGAIKGSAVAIRSNFFGWGRRRRL